MVIQESDYLEHYGILGMKWGIRRTPEQLGHRSSESGNKNSIAKKVAGVALGTAFASIPAITAGLGIATGNPLFIGIGGAQAAVILFPALAKKTVKSLPDSNVKTGKHFVQNNINNDRSREGTERIMQDMLLHQQIVNQAVQQQMNDMNLINDINQQNFTIMQMHHMF